MTFRTGSCQGGATACKVEADLSHPVMCHCSRCRRPGRALAFVPEAIRHQFCTICGSEDFSFAPDRQGNPTVAANINCLDGVDAHDMALKAQVFDGASP